MQYIRVEVLISETSFLLMTPVATGNLKVTSFHFWILGKVHPHRNASHAPDTRPDTGLPDPHPYPHRYTPPLSADAYFKPALLPCL